MARADACRRRIPAMHQLIDKVSGPGNREIFHRGPPLSAGPLPSVFYFALSGYDSLHLDPFNHPAVLLKGSQLRCFSFTLPGHGPEFKINEAMGLWASSFRKGLDPIAPFLAQAADNISFLIKEGLVNPARLATAGLSRGGLIAALLALMDERIKIVLGFAPLTRLSTLPEFQELALAEASEKYALINFAAQFTKTTLRFYIGNRDECVNTDVCYQFIRAVAEKAFESGIRSPQTELRISPSIGRLGHGTPASVFQDGVEWLKEKMTALK